MPFAIPQDIARLFPRSHQLWWIRGEVLSAEPIHESHQAAKNGRYLVAYELQIVDRDRPDCIYTFVVERKPHFDFLPQDYVSLFGHEPAKVNTMGRIRLYVNHHTRAYGRVYPGYQSLSFVQRLLEPNFLFRTSLKAWDKASNVEPVYKELIRHILNHEDHPGNYRPISLFQGRLD